MCGIRRVMATTAAAEAAGLDAVCDLQLCVCALNRQTLQAALEGPVRSDAHAILIAKS